MNITLRKAIYHHDSYALRRFLEDGIDVNTILEVTRQDTLLHTAACIGFTKGVKILIQYGADVTRVNKYHATPFITAVIMGNTEIAIILLDSPQTDIHAQNPPRSGNSMLHIAVYNTKVELVRVLLQRGISLHVQNVDGETPLHTAVRLGYTTIVKDLLEYGADPMILNYAKKNCYDLVTKSEIKELLYNINIPEIKEPVEP